MGGCCQRKARNTERDLQSLFRPLCPAVVAGAYTPMEFQKNATHFSKTVQCSRLQKKGIKKNQKDCFCAARATGSRDDFLSRGNVLIALTTLRRGKTVEFGGFTHSLLSDVSAKHKFATAEIPSGTYIIM